MNDTAMPGEVYVCARCGRRSRDRMGYSKIHKKWNDNCTLNAVKCNVRDLVIAKKSGIVTGFKPGGKPLPTLTH